MGIRKKETAATNPGGPAAANGNFSLISDEKLIALYKNLLQCRTINRKPGGSGKSVPLRGHEAPLVGATIDLGPGDAFLFNGHPLLTGFSDGAAIARMVLAAGDQDAAFRGRKAAARNGFPSSAETHAAIGTALVHKTQANKKVSVVFSSEEPGPMMDEALQIAATHALPMVFVHQTNRHWERGLRASNGRNKKGASPTKTPWFPDIIVDRDDLVAIYRVANEAISRARLGRGPTLIACAPFYLSENGHNGLHVQDAIRHMEHYLRAKGLFDPDLKSDILAQ